jgi:uncharacterized membrane protein YphA (DoxX/SURF4 family)
VEIVDANARSRYSAYIHEYVAKAAFAVDRSQLNNLPAMTENFASWHIPAPHLLTPFVSGIEFFGGIFLLLGLLTRVSAGALGITMIVAIAGAGCFSIDRLLSRSLRA